MAQGAVTVSGGFSEQEFADNFNANISPPMGQQGNPNVTTTLVDGNLQTVINHPDPTLPDPVDPVVIDPTTNIDPNTTTTNIPVPSVTQSGVDTDDDVPMLTNIYDRLYDLKDEVVDIRGNIQTDPSDSSTTKRTQLSDIYNAIVDGADTNLTSATESSEIESAVEDFESFDFSTSSPSIIAKSDTSKMVTWDFGKGIQSFDLLNMSGFTGYDVPSVPEALGWIKNFLIVVVLMIYLFAMKNLIIEIFRTLILAQESNPVTNYSVFGNSVGALTAKIAKVAIIGAMLSAVALTIIFASTEAGILGEVSYGTLPTLISGLAGNGFMSDALMWSALFIPYVTIFTCVSTYWVTKGVSYTTILAANRLARLSS